MSVSDSECNMRYLTWRSDAALIERNTDEVDGITPGLAMLRGAAFQHAAKIGD